MHLSWATSKSITDYPLKNQSLMTRVIEKLHVAYPPTGQEEIP